MHIILFYGSCAYGKTKLTDYIKSCVPWLVFNVYTTIDELLECKELKLQSTIGDMDHPVIRGAVLEMDERPTIEERNKIHHALHATILELNASELDSRDLVKLISLNLAAPV